jgi:two-component system cell cycle response regulator
MSGKILIVDNLATNRIVLKAKLSEAFYDVIQASSGAEALEIAVAKRPDLILSNARLSDMQGAAMTKAIRAHPEMADIPVVLIFDDASDPDKLTALMAGANEVLTKPINEPLLLARLRSLLRQRHSNQDLQLHAGTASALGFSEVGQGFQTPGRVALVAPNKTEAMQLKSNLKPHTGHEYVTLSTDTAASLKDNARPADIFVLKFGRNNSKDGLRLMAELRAAPRTRHCPVIVLPGDCDNAVQATILDMGASDVVCGPVKPSELSLRISAQLRRKQNADQLRDQLHDGLKAAVIDPLTGLYNRRYALPYLERMLTSAARDGRSFAVMVADIDHFKQVNDQYGHAAGDAVLTNVAQELRENLREDDMIARIGGEEFLIVAAGYSRKQAAQAANRLCRIIQRTAITPPRQSEPVQVTISIGVAIGQAQSGTTLPSAEALLDQADQALYGAKADGRNTVILSSSRPAA